MVSGVQEYMTYTANGTEAKLLLWGQGPKWEHSSAPLVSPQGSLMAPAQAGRAGHAVRLSGQQVGFSLDPNLEPLLSSMGLASSASVAGTLCRHQLPAMLVRAAPTISSISFSAAAYLPEAKTLSGLLSRNTPDLSGVAVDRLPVQV